MKRVLAVTFTCCLVVACGDDSDPVDATPPIDAGDPNPLVVIETSLGAMTFELHPVQMPITTANFLAYVDADFYDNTQVHWVQKDWIVQGGKYAQGGTEKTPNAPIELERSARVSHVPGALSMYHAPNLPDTATSEWFIVHWSQTLPAPQTTAFDRDLAAFGLMTAGQDVLESIANVETSGSPDWRPADEVLVTEIRRE